MINKIKDANGKWVISDPEFAIMNSGDNRTGEGDGDDESAIIDFSKIKSNVSNVVVIATIYDAQVRRQNFGMVDNSYIRILNNETGEELYRYDLGEDFSIETAVVVGELYRHGGEWKFNAIGSGFEGGLASLGKNYGVNV